MRSHNTETTWDLKGSESIPFESDAAFRDWIASLWRLRGPLMFLADVLTVCSSFMLAYYIRFYAQFLVIKYVPVAAVGSYLKGALILTGIWVFLIWRDGGYESGLRGVGAPILRIRSLFMNGLYALGILIVFSFMYRGLLLSRQVYLMTGVFAFSTMVLVRVLFRFIDRDLASQGIGIQRVVVAGLDDRALDFSERLKTLSSTVRIIGYVRWGDEATEEATPGQPILGSLSQLSAIYHTNPFDKLVLTSQEFIDASGHSHDRDIAEVVNFCEREQISLYMQPGSFHIAVSQREVGNFSDMPLIRLKDASLHPAFAMIKRLMDILISAAGILAGLPLWLLIAVGIKLSGKGPVFFTQERAGLHGRPFKMYKFRSMVADAEAKLVDLVDMDSLDEPVFKIENDPRVTVFGRFLRSSSLDEIPQLLNVFLGDMSIVGPRPEELAVVKRYNHVQCRRLKAKPGITGFQQINNRGEPALAKRIKYDLIYLKHQSFLFDLYILFKTGFVVVRGSGLTH